MQKQNIDFSNWLIFFCFFYKIEGVPVSSVICTVMLFSLKQSPPSFRDKQVVTWNSYVPRICIFLWKIFIDKDKNKNINLKSWIVNVIWVIFSFLARFTDLMLKKMPKQSNVTYVNTGFTLNVITSWSDWWSRQCFEF